MILSNPVPKQLKMVFFACFISAVGLMASDLINPSLPYIMHSLNTTQSATKGLMVVYLIILGLAQFFYGTLSDNYGRKAAILLSFFIAIFGFILSASAQNIVMLYLGRSITALGAAGSPVIARAIISDVCQEETALKKAFSWFALSTQFSPAIAPVIGGFIQQYADWRASFLVLVGINLLTILFLIKAMPESHDIPQVKQSWREQLKIYASFFAMRRFVLFNLLSALILTFTFGYYTLSPFIFQHLGISPVENGLLFIFYAVGLMSGALFLSYVAHRFNSYKTFLTAACSYLILTAVAVVYFWHYPNSILAIIFFSFVLAFINGVAAPLTLSLCLQGFQQNKGAASAVQGSMRFFFSGIVSLGFNFILLNHFYQLAWIFLGVSVLILLIYAMAMGSSPE